MNVLFDECVTALGGKVVILNQKKKENLISGFKDSFPILVSGHINWERIDKKEDVYIIWDDINLPIILSKLSKVLEVIEEVTPVAFYTWIYSPDLEYVIETSTFSELKLGLI